MRKTWLTAGVGFGIGAAALLASGLSAMASTSGYDVYQTALKNTMAETDLTANANFQVTDNGTKSSTAIANIKLNRGQNAASVAATFTDSTQTQSLNVYHQDGKLIFKSSASDVYGVLNQNEPLRLTQQQRG